MKPPRYKRENAHLRKKILFERVLGKVIKRLIDIIIALQNGKQMTLKMGENKNYIGNVEFLIFFVSVLATALFMEHWALG